MKRTLINSLGWSMLLAAITTTSYAATTAQAGGTLLQFDFNESTWPLTQQAPKERFPMGTLAGKVGTIDVADSKDASGGMLLVVDGEPREGWSSSLKSGALAVKNSETNLGKLTLSFNLAVTRALPVKVIVESFNEKQERTGGLETMIYPAAAEF